MWALNYDYFIWGYRGGGCSVTTICLMQYDTSSHRVDEVVDCDLWNGSPLRFYGCGVKFLDVGRHTSWNKHAQWVTCLSVQATQEQLAGTVSRYLQRGAMYYHAATRGIGDGWVAQHWASESHHGISVPMRGSVHSVNTSKPLAHMVPYKLYRLPSTVWVFSRDSTVKTELLQIDRQALGIIMSSISCPGDSSYWWRSQMVAKTSPRLHVPAVVRLFECTAKLSETTLEIVVTNRTSNLKDNHSGEHSYCQHVTSVVLCCHSQRLSCVVVLMFNQHLDVSHLSDL